MKLELKSFAIGVLLTINVMLIMGFQSFYSTNAKEGFVDVEFLSDNPGIGFWTNSKTGEPFGTYNFQTENYMLIKEGRGENVSRDKFYSEIAKQNN